MADKKLIIVESPTKAKTIKKFLPKDCTVIASKGHIRDLPTKDLGIDIENGYKPKYVISAGKSSIVKELKNELKDSTELILATDEDREGESISWHLLQVLKPKVPYRRMVFHEITKKAILAAFENGRDLDWDLVKSQEARRILDRLYGFEVSPVLWKKLSNKKLAAGRVQSPGLKMIVEREKLRMAFKKNTYWDAKASLESKSSFDAKLDSVNSKKVVGSKDFDSISGEYKEKKGNLLLDEDTINELVNNFKEGAKWTVKDIVQRKTTTKPAIPFTTSTLQQEANRKLRLPAKQTMSLAQSLYEQGLITYMRTDSPSLSEEGTMAARREIKQLYGDNYLSPKPRYFSATSANAQEAHEAIRPAGEIFKKPENTSLTGQYLSLYRLIWMRTIACQMADAKKLNTTVTITANKANEELIFTTNGIQIEFPGFMKAYVEGKDDEQAALGNKEKLLPALKINEELTLKDLVPVSHETKAPNRFSEAALVQNLEKLGIGRPSTYATIIERITGKNYAIKRDGVLVPTFLGFGVANLLEKGFASYIDYGFTKKMEDELDQISSDELEESAYMKAFYEGENGLANQIKKAMENIDQKEAKCLKLPQISEENQIYLGPFGAYVKDDEKYINIADTYVPSEITNEDIQILKEQKKNQKKDLELIYQDDKTGKNIYYISDGRFGPYWQLGVSEGKNKPKYFGVPKGTKAEDYSVEQIKKFFSLPLEIGKNSEGEAVSIASGKYGPYIICNKESRSVDDLDTLFNLTLTSALKILAAPKINKRKTVLATPVVDFGEYNGEALGIFEGRFGFFLKLGNKNAPLPKEFKKDEAKCKAMTREEAIEFSANAKESTKKGSSKTPLFEIGEYKGNKLGIYLGRYGYYMKNGKKNVGLPKEYKQDEAKCKALTKEAAIKIIEEEE